ncbi:MAG: hypothetical protein ACI8W9_000166, partial [Psychromonas sp.]
VLLHNHFIKTRTGKTNFANLFKNSSNYVILINKYKNRSYTC